MTWPFENDTSAITKKIAKNDIDKNRVKKGFSLTTIVFESSPILLVFLAVFAIVVMYAVSIFLSIRVMKNKEM